METNQVLPHPEELTEQFAKLILTEHHQAIIVQESGAIEGQVEAIHDMRVAIRRLRVALSNFAACLPREDRRRLHDRLEHLAHALGGVRDLDVMIAALEALRRTRPTEDHVAIASLVKRLQTRRKRRHRLLINYLQTDQYNTFKLELLTPQAPAGLKDESTNLGNLKLSKPEEHGQAA